jgi:hypothetical protein
LAILHLQTSFYYCYVINCKSYLSNKNNWCLHSKNFKTSRCFTLSHAFFHLLLLGTKDQLKFDKLSKLHIHTFKVWPTVEGGVGLSSSQHEVDFKQLKSVCSSSVRNVSQHHSHLLLCFLCWSKKINSQHFFSFSIIFYDQQCCYNEKILLEECREERRIIK